MGKNKSKNFSVLDYKDGYYNSLFRKLFKNNNNNFPGSSDGKASAYNAGDLGSIPWLGRSPGEGNIYPLQYSCLENPMDRGAFGATKLDMTERLHFHFHFWINLN